MLAARSEPDPIDVHVGGRLRVRRTLLGMSQAKVGEGLGLTFQQIQKYERGANRIGSSRLYRLSRILDVPVGFFFDELPDDLVVGVGPSSVSSAEFELQRLARRETLELIRGYYRIHDDKVRNRVFNLIKALGNAI